MVIPILHIIVSLIIIGLILLQERSAGLSGIFGGEGAFYQTRRGLERIFFGGTIVGAIIFAGLAIYQLVF